MAWRTPPILRDERKRDKEGTGPSTGEAMSQSDGPATGSRHGLIGTLKQLFGDAMRCLTHKAPAPGPKPHRRRKTEDTSGFKFAARTIFRRVFRMPAIDLYTPELWQWNNPDGEHEVTADLQHTEPNHLSPRP
jgi:hypothetical protein